MLRRFIWFPVGLATAVLLVSLAVANRKKVLLVLDPFKPDAPVLSVELPLYVYLLGALTLGVLLGGISTWLTQGRWRKTARVKTQDAMRWQAEADRLSRERDATVESPLHPEQSHRVGQPLHEDRPELLDVNARSIGRPIELRQQSFGDDDLHRARDIDDP